MKYDYFDVAVRRVTGTGRIIPMSDTEDRNPSLHLCDGEQYEERGIREEERARAILKQWEREWRERNCK